MAWRRQGFRPVCTPLMMLYALIFVLQSFCLTFISEDTASQGSQRGISQEIAEVCYEDCDQICTELTSRMITIDPSTVSLSGKEEKTVHICRNFVSDVLNGRFLFLVMFGGHAVCLAEPLSKWYTYCLRQSSLATMRKFEWTNLPLINHTDISERNQTTSRSRTSTRYVDFLFLIEQPKSIDMNKSRHLASAVRSLAKVMHTDVFNIDALFSFVVYSLEGGRYIRVTDFSPDVSDAVKQLQEFVSAEIPGDQNTVIDTRLLHHLSVKESLNQLVQFLNLIDGEQLELDSHDEEATVTLSHRNYADLLILSFLDLSSKKSSAHSQNINTVRSINAAKESIDEMITTILESVQLKPTGDHPVSFHFFFNTYNSAGKAYLGDSQYTVRYTDCSHFNKAMTLKALLSSDDKHQADSLQAHLLSHGIEMQVHSWNDLLKKDCFYGVTPMLSTPSGLQYKFNNACQGDAGGLHSRSGYYCSSMHGWIRKDKKRTKSMLFEGKAPLSNQFMSSHADLLKPVTSPMADSGNGTDNDYVRLPVVQLTVNKELAADMHSNFQPVIEGQPHVLQWSPDKPFVEKMITKRRPVVLKNTVIQTWLALKKWNLSHLEENMGLDILPSVKCTNSFLTFDPDQRTPLKLNISLPFALVNMTTESFFKCIQKDVSNSVCSDGYRGHYYFGSVPDTLKSDVMPDNLLYHTEKDYKAKKQFMWISSAGMITHTHFDQDYNFFVQLMGKKRFTLWSPVQHELMYVYPRVHPMWHKSRVNYRAVDLEKFPAFAQTRGKQIELGPGDMLFVPPYTWHYVETLTPSVSLSTWSHDYKLYDHMNSIYRHDHKFDLLADPRGT